MIDTTSLIGYLLYIYICFLGVYLTAYKFGYQSWKESPRSYTKIILGIFSGTCILVGGIIGIAFLSTN